MNWQGFFMTWWVVWALAFFWAACAKPPPDCSPCDAMPEAAVEQWRATVPDDSPLGLWLRSEAPRCAELER